MPNFIILNDFGRIFTFLECNDGKYAEEYDIDWHSSIKAYSAHHCGGGPLISYQTEHKLLEVNFSVTDITIGEWKRGEGE